MARPPKPWHWKSRKTWVVIIDGLRHYLGPDKKAAYEEFHRLMLSRSEQPRPTAVSSQSVPAIVDAFLDSVKVNRAPDTFEWYRYRLERFCRYLEREHPGLRVADLKPYMVTQWCDG